MIDWNKRNGGFLDNEYVNSQILSNTIDNLVKENKKYKEVLDKIKERHWKTRRNYVEDLTKLYDKLSELLEEIE